LPNLSSPISVTAARCVSVDASRHVDPSQDGGVEWPLSANSGTSTAHMKVAGLPLVLALMSAVLLAASGFGARLGVWDYRFGFQLIRWSLYAGVATAILVIVFLLLPRLRAGRLPVLVAAFAISIGVALVPGYWLQTARAVPAINDITTDTTNPPVFVAMVALRAGSPVPVAYPGEATAIAQHQAYPDIRPIELAAPPAEAFARALDAAKRMGWEIVDAAAGDGRIEATATTPWFGFRDDVVVRVTSTAAGSRIDVRSVSRVGKSDLGTNAARVRRYTTMLGGLSRHA
jgi:uncharacterized protein (DUF1499 family)